MKLPLIYFVLLAPLPLAAVQPEDHFRDGEAALDDQLWDIAAAHFSRLLETKSLSPAEKSRAAIHLAEAWIRDGQPKKALSLLDESFAEKAPGHHFWRGQALAGLGQFGEAAKELQLEAEIPGTPLLAEAVFTRAALLLSLQKSDEALSSLRPLAENPNPAISVDARLREAEILFDLKRYEESRAAMPALTEVPSKLLPKAKFIEASLLLVENKSAEAETAFSELLDDPLGQSLGRYHAAALGHADALAERGDRESATESLLTFAEKYPESPVLEGIFKRVLDWLPTNLLPNDPVLKQLEEWTPREKLPVNNLIGANDESLLGGWPVVTPADDLKTFALYTRALALHRIKTPTAQAESKQLLTRLQLEYPTHRLASRALLQSARWLLDEGNIERAFAVLEAVRENSGLTALGGEASFLQARAAYAAGNLDAASTLFDEAAKALSGDSAQISQLNAAISRFRKTGVVTVALTDGQGKPVENPELQTDLELEQALATTPAAAARTAIELFLTRHPKHPRVPEARLAAAEAALAASPPDLSMARAQLDTIAADPAAVESVPAPRLALAHLRLTDLSGNPQATIDEARAFLKSFPGDPAADEATFTLGRLLYKTESYNDARLVLQKLAESDKDPARAQAAWLIAARAAALVGTPSSREEALALFDRAAKIPGSLGSFIMIEKARLMIDLNRLPEAVAFLRSWYRSLPPADPNRVPAGLLFGEAAYAQSSKEPAQLAEALGIYDELLKHPETTPALVNRIQYLRGMTLEQLPSRENPALKREGEAFATYYSVLSNSPNPPAELHFLELCGFRALDIKMRAEKWSAAISIAKTIASFNGERSKEAAARARDIQLKEFIYED